MRELESRRQKLQTDISLYNQKIDEIKQDLLRQQTELDRLKISVEQAQVAQREAVQRNTPELALPKPMYANKLPTEYPSSSHTESIKCKMSTCFDHSRCSLTSGFPVYLYNSDEIQIISDGFDIDGFLKTTVKELFSQNAHMTTDPKKACVFLVLVGEALSDDEIMRNNRYSISNEMNPHLKNPLNTTNLKKLPYWGGDGRNHILVNLARRDLSAGSGNAFLNQDTDRAIIVQSAFVENQYRKDFDVIVPPALGPPNGDIWQECSPMVPARRKYLLTFQGEMKANNGTNPHDKQFSEEQTLNNYIVEHLKGIASGKSLDKFVLQFECVPATEQKTAGLIRDWMLCGTDSSRKAILKDSTFSLILSPGFGEISSTLLQARLYESLRSGAIPVILGADQIVLPYEEVRKKIKILLRR